MPPKTPSRILSPLARERTPRPAPDRRPSDIRVRKTGLGRATRREGRGPAGVALVGVLALGILDGVLVAVLASVLMALGRVARPHVAFLGRIPGTDRYSDM